MSKNKKRVQRINPNVKVKLGKYYDVLDKNGIPKLDKNGSVIRKRKKHIRDNRTIVVAKDIIVVKRKVMKWINKTKVFGYLVHDDGRREQLFTEVKQKVFDKWETVKKIKKGSVIRKDLKPITFVKHI